MDASGGVVIGVVGGSGGVGASRFAAEIAASTAALTGDCLLVDLDPTGGGLDVLLGIEARPGARWSGLRLAGGVLDTPLLLAGLPAWGRISVLACDRFGLPPAAQVTQVVRAARLATTVVVDLARYPDDVRAAVLDYCTLVLLVCGSDLPAITAARSVAQSLGAVPVAAIARGSRAGAAQAAELIGVPLAARLTRTPWPHARSRALRRVARGLVAGLAGLAGVPAAAAPLPAPGWLPEIELTA